jgi:hypothetical protein
MRWLGSSRKYSHSNPSAIVEERRKGFLIEIPTEDFSRRRKMNAKQLGVTMVLAGFAALNA